MSPPQRATSSFGGGKAGKPERPTAPPPASRLPEPEASPFIRALAELLRSRGIELPPGLLEAPPEAYAGQGETVVQMMSRLKDADLLQRAGRIAGWSRLHAERAERAWESSPLIAELRRRGLPEPPRPTRVVGASFSLKKPLAGWTDDEVVQAAIAWVRLGSDPTHRDK